MTELAPESGERWRDELVMKIAGEIARLVQVHAFSDETTRVIERGRMLTRDPSLVRPDLLEKYPEGFPVSFIRKPEDDIVLTKVRKHRKVLGVPLGRQVISPWRVIETTPRTSRYTCEVLKNGLAIELDPYDGIDPRGRVVASRKMVTEMFPETAWERTSPELIERPEWAILVGQQDCYEQGLPDTLYLASAIDLDGQPTDIFVDVTRQFGYGRPLEGEKDVNMHRVHAVSSDQRDRFGVPLERGGHFLSEEFQYKNLSSEEQTQAKRNLLEYLQSQP